MSRTWLLLMRYKYFSTFVVLLLKKQMQKYSLKTKRNVSQPFEEGGKEEPSFQKELPLSTLPGTQHIHSTAFQILQEQLSVTQPNDIPIKKAEHTMPFSLLSVIVSHHRMRVSRIWPVLRTV